MTLSINTVTKPYSEVYDALLAAILPGTQWITAPTVIPYTETLTPFLVTSNLGDLVDIYVNNKLQLKVGMDYQRKQVDLKLESGLNYIWVKTSTETFLALVAATYYAIYLDSWAQDFYYYTKIRVDDANTQLSSNFSLRSVEHQIAFQDLLSPVKTLRLLTGKMSIRSLINETTSTRGVTDIATAVSGSTPVIVPTRVNLEQFEPSVYNLYTSSQDANGYEFNIWIPNTCIASYAAFITLINNLDNSIAKLISGSDSRIVLEYLGRREEHLFNFETNNCSIFNVLNEQGCLNNIGIWVSNILDSLSIAFCAYSYPLDIVVELPLNSGVLDSGSPFDSGLFDSSDPTDPYGTGFIGSPLSLPLDSGLSLDDIYAAKAYEDLECMFEPLASLLGSSLLETNCALDIDSYSSLIIDTNTIDLSLIFDSIVITDFPFVTKEYNINDLVVLSPEISSAIEYITYNMDVNETVGVINDSVSYIKS